MCVCVHIYIYVYMYVCVYIYIYIYIYMYTLELLEALSFGVLRSLGLSYPRTYPACPTQKHEPYEQRPSVGGFGAV